MQRKTIFYYLVTTTLVFFSLVATYYFKKHQQLERDVVAQTTQQAFQQLSYSEREYQSVRNQFTSIVELLSHNHDLYDYIKQPSSMNRKVVEQMWASVANNQKWYSQIRFLDLDGNEKIRLNYANGYAEASNVEQLQNKAHRDYYRYAQELGLDEIGVWGIDLQLEHGQIVKPYQPALRLITPVYIADNRAGYLVLNINVRYLTSRLNYSPDEAFRSELISEQGYYLSGDEPDELYGNVLVERKEHNFSHVYPIVWRMMQDKKSGFLNENQHLVVFHQIHLSDQETLYLVIDFSDEQLEEIAYLENEILMQEATLVFILTLAFVIPITLLAAYYRKRSLESQLARAALSGMSAVIISDSHHSAIMVNDQFCQLTGIARTDIHQRNLIKGVLGDDQRELWLEIIDHLAHHQLWEGEITLRKDSSDQSVTVLLRMQSVLAKSGRVSYYITSLVDISDRKQLEERLRILSERDELTQLWNRRKFDHELRHYSRMIERYPETPNACLALIDIDFFKRINDERGHDEGDRVICNVAAMLVNSLRDTDFVARIGGEEFAIIMPNTTVVEAEFALNRLRIAIDIATEIPVTVSIGVTDFIADSTRCYKCADIALYESKSSGRNRVSACFSSEEVA